MNMREDARRWYFRTFGKEIPATSEDYDREQEEQEERDWYYEKKHRQGLVNSMAGELADGR
jgi:hypothetical protein